jgi:hypothetical protein
MKDIAAADVVHAVESCTTEDERESQPVCILESIHPISLPAEARLFTVSTVKNGDSLK